MALEAKEAYKRLESLKSKRNTYDSHWQELGDYFLPNKGTITRERYAGEKTFLHIYDSSGIQAVELFAGALHSMLTNPTSYWFEYTTGDHKIDRDDEVRKWLQETTHVTHEVMNNSNFQTEIHEIYLDQNVFGHGILSVMEDDDDVVRFSAKHVKNCWIDENNKGHVDTIYYCFKWKPRQIIQEFGEKAVPEFILKIAQEKPEEEIELLQVVCPNSDYAPNKKLDPAKGKKFMSCTYVREGAGECHELSRSGFDTFPFLVPRWSKGTGEVYGRSPAMKCLSDVKMINEMMKETIRAQQKRTNPPLLVPDDGVTGSLKLFPGGVNYYRAGNGDFIKPLDAGGDLQLSFQMMDDVRNRIRDCFYISQLQLQQGPQMTATEVMQRTEEQIRLLGPLLGRQHSELLRPLIERVYDILDKKKLIPQPPRVLSGRRIDVKYRSMLAKAQLASEANNIQRAVQTASPFIQIDPRAAQVINCDEGVRYAAQLYGLPQELIRDQSSIEDMRQAQDEANQRMLEAQEAQQGVEQVAKLAPAVKMAMEGGAPARR